MSSPLNNCVCWPITTAALLSPSSPPNLRRHLHGRRLAPQAGGVQLHDHLVAFSFFHCRLDLNVDRQIDGFHGPDAHGVQGDAEPRKRRIGCRPSRATTPNCWAKSLTRTTPAKWPDATCWEASSSTLPSAVT